VKIMKIKGRATENRGEMSCSGGPRRRGGATMNRIRVKLYMKGDTRKDEVEEEEGGWSAGYT